MGTIPHSSLSGTHIVRLPLNIFKTTSLTQLYALGAAIKSCSTEFFSSTSLSRVSNMRDCPLQCDLSMMDCKCFGSLRQEDDEVVCDACPPGTFTPTPSVWAAPLATCLPCVSGTFSARLGSSRCMLHTTCAPGTAESVAATASSDRECKPCVIGESFTSQVSERREVWVVLSLTMVADQRGALPSSQRAVRCDRNAAVWCAEVATDSRQVH
jgi:hypothetical protein